MFGFMITCPREHVSSSWIMFHGKVRKSWTTTLRSRDVTLLMPCAFLHSVHKPTYYSIKYNIYWLLSWMEVKHLMDGDVWEILRIKNKKLNTINDTVSFLNWWGKRICIVAAEKHKNFYSCQYGDWDRNFHSRYSDTLWTGRSRDGIPVGMKFAVMSRPVVVLTQRPVQWARDLFPGGKEAGVWH